MISQEKRMFRGNEVSTHLCLCQLVSVSFVQDVFLHLKGYHKARRLNQSRTGPENTIGTNGRNHWMADIFHNPLLFQTERKVERRVK